MALSVRTVRRVAGVVLIAGVAYVGWLLSRVQHRPSAQVQEQRAQPGEVPAAPQEESGCFDDLVLDWAGDRLEAGRGCKQPDGHSKLDRVVLTLRRSDGQEQMSVRADRGRVAEKPGSPVELEGNVHVSTPQGLVLDGERLVVDRAASTVTTDRPVSFSQGDLAGSGGRLLHDWGKGRTLLETEPEIVIRGQRTRGRDITLTAATIDHDSAAQRVLATTAAELAFADGTIRGDLLDVALSSDGNEVRSILATGNASTRTRLSGTGPDGRQGPPVERTLAATQIQHAFGAGSNLREIVAEGGARMDGRSTEPAASISERLEGDRLALSFGSSATIMLTGIAARGAPARFSRTEPGASRTVEGRELDLTSGERGFETLEVRGAGDLRDSTPTLRRHLVADDAELSFAPGGSHLEAIVFSGKPGKLVEEVIAPVASRRTVAADRGSIRLDASGPTSGALTGRVELDDGRGRASADRAVLEESPRRTILRGNAAVEREGRISHGDEIISDEKAGTLKVSGRQHTLVRDEGGIPGMAAASTSEPVLISSDTLILVDRPGERRATYEGGRPALRRGDTELVADRLVLDDVLGTLHATGDVRSRLRLSPPGSAVPSDSPIDPTRLVDGRAEEFHYRRAERRVSYSGSASLTQEDTVLTADRVDIFLTETEPARVRQLDAEGTAFFRAPSRGEAEGEKLRWLAADDAFVVEGGVRPARALDAEGNFQTGALLEMRKGSVRALASPAGRARGSAPVKAPAP